MLLGMPIPRLSLRAIRTPASPIRKLATLAVAARKRGIRVHELNIGQPDLPTPPEFFSAIRRFVGSTVAYAPSAGEPETIRAWQKYYRSLGLSFKSDQILVTTGGSEAIMFALFAVTNPGDEVLVFEPFYPNYATFVRLAGAKLQTLPLHAEDGYALPSAATLARAIGPRTRALLICNPDNPSGAVRTPAEIRMLLDVARRKNLFVIADETYREIVFPPARSLSLATPKATRDRVILVDSASKRFNVCGARIGCIASTNMGVMESALKFAQSRLSSPTLDQCGVTPLLEHSSSLIRPLVREYRRRTAAVVERLRTIPGVTFVKPHGSFYLLARLPVADTEHFCRWLVEKFSDHKETLLLAPASGFYATPGLGRQEVRIACVLSVAKLRRAMVILERALAAYPGRRP